MKNINELLKDIDWQKVAKKLIEEKQRETQKKESFWNSSLCQAMIDDMKRVKQGFDVEDFAYFPDKVKARFGWENIADDDINQFIHVMSDCDLGVDDKTDFKTDKDCIFENFSFVKKGIVISIMHGQGTAIDLTPEMECNSSE